MRCFTTLGELPKQNSERLWILCLLSVITNWRFVWLRNEIKTPHSQHKLWPKMKNVVLTLDDRKIQLQSALNVVNHLIDPELLQFALILIIFNNTKYYIMMGEKSCMPKAVSCGYCTVYRASVGFLEKITRLGHFACCLPCVTHSDILLTHQQILAANEKQKWKNQYSFRLTCNCVCGLYKKSKQKQQFNWLQLTLGFPSSRIQHVSWKLSKIF